MAHLDTAFPIKSEEIEPFAAMFVGRLFARCEEAKATGDEDKYYFALNTLWYGLHGLEKIAIAAVTATHFSIAMNNHVCLIARYIKDEIGVDPMTAPGWKWK